jgi:hypothetical protein
MLKDAIETEYNILFGSFIVSLTLSGSYGQQRQLSISVFNSWLNGESKLIIICFLEQFELTSEGYT